LTNSESFIAEVSSEVRSDRLFKQFKKWAWVVVVLGLIMLGYSAYREYSSYVKVTKAKAIGDQITQALESEEPTEAIAALDSITIDNPNVKALVKLQIAAQYSRDNNPEQAITTLKEVSLINGADQHYKDLALFKTLVLEGNIEPSEKIVSDLNGLIVAGSPFTPIIRETKSYFDYSLGETQAQYDRQQEAIDSLKELYNYAETSENQKFRIQQFLLSIGESESF